jgi:hypothetical protein
MPTREFAYAACMELDKLTCFLNDPILAAWQAFDAHARPRVLRLHASTLAF